MRCRREQGQVAPVLAIIVVVVVLGLLVMSRVGRVTIDRARARTAADAAALIGVREGRAAAEAMAERNGARLTEFVDGGREVEVTVVLGSAEASARARLGASTDRPSEDGRSAISRRLSGDVDRAARGATTPGGSG